MRSFRGSSARLLIVIRGPNFVQAWLMILSSAAMVCSCGPEACLTSIVNCFIYPLLLALVRAPWNTLLFPQHPNRCMISQIYCTGKSSNEGKTVSYHLWDRLSSLGLVACGLQLFSFFNFFLIQYPASRRIVGCLRISDILTVVYFIISWPSPVSDTELSSWT